MFPLPHSRISSVALIEKNAFEINIYLYLPGEQVYFFEMFLTSLSSLILDMTIQKFPRGLFPRFLKEY